MKGSWDIRLASALEGACPIAAAAAAACSRNSVVNNLMTQGVACVQQINRQQLAT
jgi:hypothetical protein